jgi:Pin2-interacting protein X1
MSITAITASLPDTQNKAWRSDKNSFAQKLLAKMGWTEGKGLGKREDGIVDHVRVKRRIDSAGIGIASSIPDGIMGGRNGNEVLLSAVSDFNAMLSKMAAKKAVDVDTEEHKDEISAERNEESEEANVVDEEERRRQRKLAKKLKRKRLEESESAKAEDEGKDAEIEDETMSTNKNSKEGNNDKKMRDEDAPKATINKTAHVPAGRHKVLRQKNTSRYSAADMAAILGQLPGR